METLSMSVKERRRLAVLSRVEQGQITLGEASEQMPISYRQARRVWKRYRELGDAGLVHRLRGRAGNRGKAPARRERAVELVREHYADFGPTLAAEYLAARHELVVDDQTLRRWLQAAGLWVRRRKSPRKRRRREPRARRGELVQIDGSEHDWFEGRRGRCVLMVMVDDATKTTLARFFEAETTEAAMTIFRCWALAYGLPSALYPDRHSIYRVNTKKADEVETRTGRRPPTQLGRALAELGVGLICVRSPQAKGRVERMNGTLQDRLVKALRVEGIEGIEAANAYLEEAFLPALNEKFAVAPADEADAHTPTAEARLDAALCVREERAVSKDQCIIWDKRVLQLEPGRGAASLSGKRVQVRRGLDDGLRVLWRDQPVEYRQLPRRPEAGEDRPTLAERVAGHKGPWMPPANHPWRRVG